MTPYEPLRPPTTPYDPYENPYDPYDTPMVPYGTPTMTKTNRYSSKEYSYVNLYLKEANSFIQVVLDRRHDGHESPLVLLHCVLPRNIHARELLYPAVKRFVAAAHVCFELRHIL